MRRNSFEEEKVRKAHELSGHKTMADIISMLKNADTKENPLLTAEERVNQALVTLAKGHSFTPEQKEWLQYIKEHLVINLAIERDNFDIVPVLERHGGLTQARKIFGESLDSILEEINYQLAA